MNYQRVVILKEKEGDRYLPIWIGPHEAEAIAVKLQNITVTRPMSHDLMGNIISTLGGKIIHILITDLENDTFYAQIVVQGSNGEQISIDSRPSDAIALAIRSKAQIFASESVLDKAGVSIDSELGKSIRNLEEDDDGVLDTSVDEEEIKNMSAFRDFIEGLNLDDLEKDKQKHQPNASAPACQPTGNTSAGILPQSSS